MPGLCDSPGQTQGFVRDRKASIPPSELYPLSQDVVFFLNGGIFVAYVSNPGYTVSLVGTLKSVQKIPGSTSCGQ